MSPTVKRGLIIGLAAVALLIGAAALAALLFNPQITSILEGPAFKAELDKQTSKGLHFKGEYDSIKRVGFFGGFSPGFKSGDGEKAFKSIDAKDISATFNPWGILLRRWQLDNVKIGKANAEIQVYEPKPDNKPPKPWYSIFMPDRVYLTEVRSDDATIWWKMKDKKAGFFDTHIRITPYGRDFEYHAEGGTFKMSPAPDMPLAKLHMRITKQEFTLYALDLTPTEKGRIHVQGKAGMKGDKSTRVEATFEAVPIKAWLPADWKGAVRGTASGNILWEGKDQKIESSHGKGTFRLNGAYLRGVPFLDYAAAATRNEEIKDLEIESFSFDFNWAFPSLEVENLYVEAPEAFCLTGTLKLEGKSLSGTVQLGVNPKNIAWLPKAQEQIFTKMKNGYCWTTVKLSGTIEKPENDLAPRIAEVLKESPAETGGAFFRTVGEWFQQTFSGGTK